MIRKIGVALMMGSLSLVSFAGYGACKVDESTLKVAFTGYKTAKKLPVSGRFTKVAIKGGQGKDLLSALKTTGFTIDGTKIDSGDKGRDAKLGAIFFGAMSGGKISGKVDSIKDGYAYVSLTMNGVTKPVPLKLSMAGKAVEAQGVIDIMDFGGSSPLAALNKACFEKHEGKTWSEGAVTITASCK